MIGGYLGAGKTTLVNHLLREGSQGPNTERIAVLVNDFGDVNIDLDLIERRTEDTIELSNGCICCSIIDGFAEALDRIASFEPRPDRLVIEASGVADPAAIAAYGHGPDLALDAVIVLVDAETIRTNADDRYVGQTVRQQLTAAEIVVLNKSDLVATEELAKLHAWLSSQCPQAFVVTATNSKVAAEVLFGRPPTHRPVDSGTDHHNDVFHSRTIAFDAPPTRDDFDSFMHNLGERCVRAKGFVQLAEDPDLVFVVQRVGRRWTLRRSHHQTVSRLNSIVVIEVRDPNPEAS